jgi:hypothetical protein
MKFNPGTALCGPALGSRIGHCTKPHTLCAIILQPSINMEFSNNRYFTKQIFNLSMTQLKIHRKTIFNSIEYELSLEHVSNKKVIETKFNDGIFITGLFFFLIGLLFQLGPNDQLTITFITIGAIFSSAAFIGRKKVITIPSADGLNITLFFINSNKEEVLKLADTIINASNEFLLNKYAKIDKALPIAPQIEGIQFLRNREILSEEQFELLKNQLLGRDYEPKIGFVR